VNWAERQVQAIESQSDALNGFNERTQANLQAMREQADAWRDAQLAGMDAQLQALLGMPLELAQSMVTTPATTQIVFPPAVVATYASDSANQTAEMKGLKEELAALRKDMVIIANTNLKPLQAIETKIAKWDADGLPAGSGPEQTVTLLQAA